MTAPALATINPLDTNANMSRVATQAYMDQHGMCPMCSRSLISNGRLFIDSVSWSGKVTLVCWLCDAIRRGAIKHEYLNP